jgi:hypothetical protein
MGAYYKCLCGDSEHLALMEHDAVALQDARGRNWICYTIADQEAEELPMLAHVADVFETDAIARRQGIGGDGTEVRIYYCENEDELFEKLLLDTASGDGEMEHDQGA